MRYASECAGVMTSVHQWKPIPPDRFASLLHHYTTAVADLHGHDAISTTALALDRDATATIYYRRSERGSAVSSPVLMTMEGVAGKTLCFETTNPAFALEPVPASEVIRSAFKARDDYRAGRLAAVAKAAAKILSDASKQYPGVVVIAPREADFAEVEAAINKAGGQGDLIRRFTPARLISLAGPTLGIWLHNADLFGGPVLTDVMHHIANVAEGKGWMGMTGQAPMGWPSPDGLPTERV